MSVRVDLNKFQSDQIRRQIKHCHRQSGSYIGSFLSPAKIWLWFLESSVSSVEILPPRNSAQPRQSHREAIVNSACTSGIIWHDLREIFLKYGLPYILLFPALKITPTSSTYCILNSSQCLCLGNFCAKLMSFARPVKMTFSDKALIFHTICQQKRSQPRQPQREALMGTKNHQCLHLRWSEFDSNGIFLQL